jgi:hypothetical protein
MDGGEGSNPSARSCLIIGSIFYCVHLAFLIFKFGAESNSQRPQPDLIITAISSDLNPPRMRKYESSYRCNYVDCGHEAIKASA